MSRSPTPPEPDAPRRTSRHGPGLALLGVLLWIATIAAYVLLKPPEAMPGEAMRREAAVRLVLTFVVAALGVFAASIVSAVGLLLSLSERRRRGGRRAALGVASGVIGVAALVPVIVEIFRQAFAER